MKAKRCPSCRMLKPATAEYWATDTRRPDRLQAWCRVCQSKNKGRAHHFRMVHSIIADDVATALSKLIRNKELKA